MKSYADSQTWYASEPNCSPRLHVPDQSKNGRDWNMKSDNKIKSVFDINWRPQRQAMHFERGDTSFSIIQQSEEWSILHRLSLRSLAQWWFRTNLHCLCTFHSSTESRVTNLTIFFRALIRNSFLVVKTMVPMHSNWEHILLSPSQWRYGPHVTSYYKMNVQLNGQNEFSQLHRFSQ